MVDGVTSDSAGSDRRDAPSLRGSADGISTVAAFLRRYKRWLIGVPLVFALLALLAQLVVARPLYEATAVVTIGRAPKVGGFAAPKMTPTAYQQLAVSASILERVSRDLRQAGVFVAQRDMSRDHLRAELGKPSKGDEADTAVLLLTYWAESGEVAAAVSNAWAAMLVDFERTQAYRAALRWSITEAKNEQLKLDERIGRISDRLAATRAVLSTTPQGLVLSGRRNSSDGEDGGGSSLSLSREDRTAVSAELAMRAAESEIELQVVRPKLEEVETRLEALSSMNQRFSDREVDIDQLVEEDTSGLLAGLQTRAQLLQPARGLAESPSRQIVFKVILAALAGLLLVFAAAALRETVARRTA